VIPFSIKKRVIAPRHVFAQNWTGKKQVLTLPEENWFRGTIKGPWIRHGKCKNLLPRRQRPHHQHPL